MGRKSWVMTEYSITWSLSWFGTTVNVSDLRYSAFSIKINTNNLISIFAYREDILCYIKHMIISMYTLLAGLLLGPGRR